MATVRSQADVERLSEVQRLNGILDRGFQDPRFQDEKHYKIPPGKNQNSWKKELFPLSHKKELFGQR